MCVFKKSTAFLGWGVCIVLCVVFIFYRIVGDLRIRSSLLASENTYWQIEMLGSDIWAVYGKIHGVWPESLEIVAEYVSPFDSHITDTWSTEYRYVGVSNICIISSAGPDKTFDTKDDILKLFMGAPNGGVGGITSPHSSIEF